MKTCLLPAVALLALAWVPSVAAQDYWGDTGYAGAAGASGATTAAAGYDTSYTGGDTRRGGGLLGDSAFNYGYLDGSYYWFDFDNDNFDSAHGFGAALSVPLIDSLFLKGALNYASSDTLDGDDVDFLDWQAGGGIGLPIFNRVDLVLEGGLAHRSLEVDGINDFDDLVDGYGWYVAPGVRVNVTDFLEINGTVRYISVDSDSDVGIDVRALLHLTPSISLQGGVLFSDDANQYGVGLRINF